MKFSVSSAVVTLTLFVSLVKGQFSGLVDTFDCVTNCGKLISLISVPTPTSVGGSGVGADACAQACINKAVSSQTKCALTDTACQCTIQNKGLIQLNALLCLSGGACTGSDSLAAYVLVNDICKGSLNGGTSQTQKPTTTSAVAGTASTASKPASSSGTGTVTANPTGTAANQSPGSVTENTPSSTIGGGSSPTGKDQPPASSSSLSAGAKAGIGIGAVVGCAVIALLVYIALLLRKRRGKSQSQNGDGDGDGTPEIVMRAPELDGAAVVGHGKGGFLQSKQWEVEAKGDDGHEVVVDVRKEGDALAPYGGAPGYGGGGLGVQVEELDGQTRTQLDEGQPRNLNEHRSPVQVRGRGVVGELPG